VFIALPSEYLEPLRRQKSFIAIFVTSAILTSLALTYVASEKYEAGTTIYYRPADVTRLKGSDTQSLGSPVPAPPFKIIGNTLQDIALNQALLEEVVLELNLHERPPAYEEDSPWYTVAFERSKELAKQWAGFAVQILKHGRALEEAPLANAMANLGANIAITSDDSFVFKLKVRDSVPERAARIADTVSEKLVVWLRDQERHPGSQKEEQLGELIDAKKEEIRRLRARMRISLGENELVSPAEETEAAIRGLSDLELERVKLESEIEEQQTRLAELSERMGWSREVPRAAGGDDRYIQPDDFTRLASERLFTEIDLAAKRARYESLEVSIAKLRRQLERHPAIQAEVDELTTLIVTAEREFMLLSDSYEEAAVRATELRSEGRVLHAASIPTSPVAPIKVYHVSLSATLSLVLSVGLVYLLTFFNIRILFPSEGVRGRAPRGPDPGEPPDPPREQTEPGKVSRSA
jgi:uncharacterized protein involved in exopolysaccharide biosynthesis